MENENGQKKINKKQNKNIQTASCTTPMRLSDILFLKSS